MITQPYKNSIELRRELDARIAANMKGIPNPCMNCTDRHVACHCSCLKRERYVVALEDAKDKAWNAIKGECLTKSIVDKRIARIKTVKRRKN